MSQATVTHAYEDRFGEVIDHADYGYLEIRWYDATEAMSVGDFQSWLAAFAGEVERRRRPGILVDVTRFLMDQSGMDDAWWYEQIVPRYNGAGVEKFAFLAPDGTPAIGDPPAATGPANFSTGYFGRRQDALDWLGS
jgi:hypothetical protein